MTTEQTPHYGVDLIGPPTLNEFVQDFEERINVLEQQKIELAQGVRDFARADVERRIGNLVPRLIGETNVMNNRKSLEVVDEANVLTKFQVPRELRRLLYEENEPGNFEIEVVYNEKQVVSVKNAATGNAVWVSASFIAYAMPMLAARTDRRVDYSLVEQSARQYGERALRDEQAMNNYDAAKAMIGAMREIAFDSGKLTL